MRFFLTKADRVLKRPEFIHLSKTGRPLFNRHFVATIVPGRFEHSRLGITVSKKVGHAATRNRIKRIIREYFRRNKHTLGGIWDINISAKKSVAELSTAQAFAALKNIFDRIASSRHDS